MELKILQAHPLFVTQERARPHTEQYLMRILEVMRQVVAIARHNQRDVQLLSHTAQTIVNLRLHIPVRIRLGVAMVLQFQIVAVAKDTLIPLSNLYCLSIVVIAQCLAYLTTCTATQDN